MTNPNYKTPLRVSVSSWALHPLLNRAYPGRPGDPDGTMFENKGDAPLTLLEVPAHLAKLGIHTMELCHFHLPSRDDSYLAEFQEALKSVDVELWSLLIDEGDLVHPEHHARDFEWVKEWVDTATALGAKHARIIAGKQPPTPQNLALSRDALSHLADYVEGSGLRLFTENWFALLPTAEVLNPFLESLEGRIGLCFDFGNWSGDSKYEELTKIAHLAESCHAKCFFGENAVPNRDDFLRCIEITRHADFSGPYTLVAADAGDVWGTIAVQRDLLLSTF
ncbi:MAG: sugar phosphate isomerase/epimerase [Chthonomonadaceae bacterium]|nr:sugar phosphate isomerase/epimerase [Chthonomonadaceae bacterium]